MSRQTLLEIKSGMCGKKIPYPTYDDALEAYWEVCNKRSDTENLDFYLCPFCNSYHLGNNKNSTHYDKKIRYVKEHIHELDEPNEGTKLLNEVLDIFKEMSIKEFEDYVDNVEKKDNK